MVLVTVATFPYMFVEIPEFCPVSMGIELANAISINQ